MIREARFLMALMLLYAAFSPGVGQNDLPGGSDAVSLGSGPRPIYRIGYNGDGPVDIDELIETMQSSREEGGEDLLRPDGASEASSSEPSSSLEVASSDPPAETAGAEPLQDAPKEEAVSDRSEIAAVQIEDEKPPYVRVPIVSDPPGAEVYVDGIFYGVTPFIATVEPESHLVEVYLQGYWNWFNVVDFSESTRTIPVILSPREPAPPATDETQEAQNASAMMEDLHPTPETSSRLRPTSDEGDFVEENYRKLLIVVAFLSFLIGSGSIASWARSRLTTSVKISFPRDGEERWAGLVEGQSSRIRGTKRQVYVLVRYDDENLQVRKQVVPNRDGRWYTRCDVEEGTVYRIYAVVVDGPLIEGSYLDEIPTHRAISEVGPVIGREKVPMPADR
ncbi:PEGA domain-containing protein [Methanocrinis sp.]|uniref:PEGA domain-containing protein n=1 Tax=Methanocrinis sp. TaxID=3101522 RepID=UPI003D104140